jgi:hypothetical protein
MFIAGKKTNAPPVSENAKISNNKNRKKKKS